MLTELFSNCAYAVKYETKNDVDYAFVEDKDTLYIYFEGSKQKRDWLYDFWFTKRVYKMFRVHSGFYKQYSEVRDIILDKCYSKDYNKFVVVGYSLGSALATICHEDIAYHFPNKDIRTYAFESPRSLKVSKKYKHIWNNLTRVENNWDLVAHCPPKFVGYSDLGTLVKVKGDTSMVRNKLPKCIKSHFAECVLDGLRKFEQ